MASLKDVALKAGVSTATVSRVINNHPNVSWETRRIVHAAMNELSYLPIKSTISLEGKRSGLLGCIVPNLTNPHFSEAIMILEQEARFYGMDIIVKTHLNNPEKESTAVRSFIALGIEGLFWVPTENEGELVDELRRSGIFTVVITQRSRFFNSILVDYRDGMRQAAMHLREQGWKRAGFIGQRNVDEEKYTVFKDALFDLNSCCSLDNRTVFWLPKGIAESISQQILLNKSSRGDSDDECWHQHVAVAAAGAYDTAVLSGGSNGVGSDASDAPAASGSGYRHGTADEDDGSAQGLGHYLQMIVDRLIETRKDDEPVALWVYNDVCAVALEKACLKSGLKIPDDAGIISFDNTYLTQLMDLSSIGQPVRAIASKAYSLLADKKRSVSARNNMNANDNIEDQVDCLEIKPQLFVRSSTIKSL